MGVGGIGQKVCRSRRDWSRLSGGAGRIGQIRLGEQSRLVIRVCGRQYYWANVFEEIGWSR